MIILIIIQIQIYKGKAQILNIQIFLLNKISSNNNNNSKHRIMQIQMKAKN